MNIAVFFYITSRVRFSQINPHSDYLNIRGRGRHQKTNFFKHWSSFNCREIFSFLKSFVSMVLAGRRSELHAFSPDQLPYTTIAVYSDIGVLVHEPDPENLHIITT